MDDFTRGKLPEWLRDDVSYDEQLLQIIRTEKQKAATKEKEADIDDFVLAAAAEVDSVPDQDRQEETPDVAGPDEKNRDDDLYWDPEDYFYDPV